MQEAPCVCADAHPPGGRPARQGGVPDSPPPALALALPEFNPGWPATAARAIRPDPTRDAVSSLLGSLPPRSRPRRRTAAAAGPAAGAVRAVLSLVTSWVGGAPRAPWRGGGVALASRRVGVAPSASVPIRCVDRLLAIFGGDPGGRRRPRFRSRRPWRCRCGFVAHPRHPVGPTRAIALLCSLSAEPARNAAGPGGLSAPQGRHTSAWSRTLLCSRPLVCSNQSGRKTAAGCWESRKETQLAR